MMMTWTRVRVWLVAAAAVAAAGASAAESPLPRTVAMVEDRRSEVRVVSFGFLVGGRLNATVNDYKARGARGRESERRCGVR